MMESLFALPLGAGAEVMLFLVLYRLSPLNAKQAAVVVFLIAATAVLLYSLLNWPGADVLAMYIAVLAVTAYLLAIVNNVPARRQPDTDGSRRWFHWGPAIIVIFFVVLFALDGLLVVISRQGLPEPLAERLLPKFDQQERVRSVFPGTVTNDFQKKEALYNRYLEQVERQEQRGWQVHKGWLHTPLTGEPATFQVRVLEADGAPVRFASVSGIFQRPADSREDRPFDMQETEPGLYRTEVILPEPGRWHLLLKIRRGEQLHELHASTMVETTGQAQP